MLEGDRSDAGKIGSGVSDEYILNAALVEETVKVFISPRPLAGEGPGERAADVANRNITHEPRTLSRPSATLSRKRERGKSAGAMTYSEQA